MRVTRKIFIRTAANLNFLINLTDFLKKVYTQITTLAALFFVEKQTVLPFIVQRKRSQFIRINLLVVNHLNGEFYWPKTFHYGFEIQSLP